MVIFISLKRWKGVLIVVRMLLIFAFSARNGECNNMVLLSVGGRADSTFPGDVLISPAGFEGFNAVLY